MTGTTKISFPSASKIDMSCALTSLYLGRSFSISNKLFVTVNKPPLGTPLVTSPAISFTYELSGNATVTGAPSTTPPFSAESVYF